jgi:aminopeptidase N
MTKAEPKTIYLKDYEAPTHTIENTYLTFELFEGHTFVTQKTTYKRDASKRADLKLNHGKDIDIVQVHVNGKNITNYKLNTEFLTIPCPGDDFTLEIKAKIRPEKNTSLNGLYKSGGNYTTQCEAEGFRNITFWMDRPDVMTIFTVRIEADKEKYPVLLSNGNCIDSGDLDGGRHFAVWHDPHKKPCYLFALVAGDLVMKEDFFKTMSGNKVTLRIYTRDGDLPQVDFAMQALKDSMKWDEEAYGREYDLDIFNIVAVGDFNMGAMENKSLNIFNTALVLAEQKTATDADFLRVERVIGHEYFHNWSGNRVTCRDWFQLSLKEGFTVYRENQFGQAMNDAVTERIDEVTLLRDLQFSEDASPMAHPIRPEEYIEINNFYTMTVYEKGGEVIRMINTLLGDDMYRKGSDLYFSRHDGDAATCDDFLKAMQDASANKYLDQFKLWYSQAGTPVVTAKSKYDDAKKKVTITFTQKTPDTPGQKNKKPVVIPIKTGLIGQDGVDIDESTLILTKDKQDFTFDNVDEKPAISYLREFSAPVILKTDQTESDLIFMLRHDSDGFNKWESAQKIMLSVLNSDSNDLPDGFIDALHNCVHTLKDHNKALLVRLLTLPGDSTIANAQKHVDPDKIAKAKDALTKAIANALSDDLDMLFETCAPTGDFSTSPEAMARRALRNLILKYKLSVDEGGAIRAAFDQYSNATTMTEKLGSLAVLVETDRPERDHAIANFYEEYQQYPLVIDKWFSVQACSARHDTPARVAELLNHPDFTLDNPNRTRALIGVFAMRNQKGFHVLSGEGYKILTDIIIKLNDKNPQIASRLLTPMRGWKSYTADRQKLMKAQLKRIMDQDNLSPDVFEIVSKCLKG